MRRSSWIRLFAVLILLISSCPSAQAGRSVTVQMSCTILPSLEMPSAATQTLSGADFRTVASTRVLDGRMMKLYSTTAL
jgi:hypothetical protein